MGGKAPTGAAAAKDIRTKKMLRGSRRSARSAVLDWQIDWTPEKYPQKNMEAWQVHTDAETNGIVLAVVRRLHRDGYLVTPEG